MCPALPHRNAASHRGISVFRTDATPVRRRQGALPRLSSPAVCGDSAPGLSRPAARRRQGWAGACAVPPPLPSALAGGTLAQSLGSFVTLNKDGDLRGCIGNMVGREPLWQNVWRMARAAAFEDPRFPALDAEEWTHCHLHISVLGPLSPCPDPARIVIGRHGLLLRLGMRQGVFLPQVPVEQGWDLGQYLEHLCRKAGLPAGSWRDPQALLFWFESLVFEA